MPSGKTHDVITILLSVPVYAVGWSVFNFGSALCLTIAFLFGGFMFGPDLDTVSKQYSRWSIFRILWLPYRSAFKHRSRWSHGLVFGTLFRVVYFCGIVTLAAFATAFIYATYAGGKIPDLIEFTSLWGRIGNFFETNLGDFAMPFVFLGLWLGAASHTLTDIAGTYIKTGRAKGFL